MKTLLIVIGIIITLVCIYGVAFTIRTVNLINEIDQYIIDIEESKTWR